MASNHPPNDRIDRATNGMTYFAKDTGKSAPKKHLATGLGIFSKRGFDDGAG